MGDRKESHLPVPILTDHLPPRNGRDGHRLPEAVRGGRNDPPSSAGLPLVCVRRLGPNSAEARAARSGSAEPERIDSSMNTWRLADITYGHVKASLPYEVAVLPLGATEPHNLHLPYG